MNENNPSSDFEPGDPLLNQLSSLLPAKPEGFESRVMYSAGRADAFREFSTRNKRRIWLNAAAMLLIAAGSSAFTWNFSARELHNNTLASAGLPAENSLTLEVTTPDGASNSLAVSQNASRASTNQPLNQWLDDLLGQHLPSNSIAMDRTSVDSNASTVPISTAPRTWLQLQRELLRESDLF